MAVRINIHEMQIKQKMEQAWQQGVAMLSSQILKDCNKYAKFDTKTLIESSYIHSQLDKGLLIWQTPYAARQYYEIQTAHTDNNPDASWRWVEVAESRHRERWSKQAQAITRYYG